MSLERYVENAWLRREPTSPPGDRRLVGHRCPIDEGRQRRGHF